MNSRWEFQSICICISVSQGAGVSRLGGWAAWPQHRHYTPTLDTGHRPHQCTQGNNEDKLHSMHQYIYYTCLGVIYWVCPHTPPFFPIVQCTVAKILSLSWQIVKSTFYTSILAKITVSSMPWLLSSPMGPVGFVKTWQFCHYSHFFYCFTKSSFLPQKITFPVDPFQGWAALRQKFVSSFSRHESEAETLIDIGSRRPSPSWAGPAPQPQDTCPLCNTHTNASGFKLAVGV